MDFKKIQTNPYKLKQFSNELFQKTDKNRNGFVTLDELFPLMNVVAKELNSRPPTQEEMSIILQKVDKNHDHQISAEEFIQITEILLQVLSR